MFHDTEDKSFWQGRQRQAIVNDWYDILSDIAHALAEFEESGFVHCDIKPGNILVNYAHGRYHGKLADFDKSFQTGCGYSRQSYGTTAYSDRNHKNKIITHRDDMFALGMTVNQIRRKMDRV